MNESALLQGLRQQDPAAVKHLSKCFLPSVWCFVYVKVNRDHHLAEDIVSETVLALVKAAADDDTDIRNLSAWLRSVAANKVTDHFRAAARVQHLIDQVKQTAPACNDNDAAKLQVLRDRRREVRDVMDQLTDQHRMVLEWKYLEKLSVREMAERLETTEKAVESTLFRARRDFRERLTRADNRDGTAITHSVGKEPAETRDKTSAKENDNDSEGEPVVRDHYFRAELG